MPQFFAILLMALVAAGAMAGGINFFWHTGWKKALQIAALFVFVALVFGLSGMWEGSSRHAWGIWTPVFALMLATGWLAMRYGGRLWRLWRKKEDEANKQ